MGRIQSNVGLITGIPITDTIDQLIGVASAPLNNLSVRTRGLQQEQVAINTLSSRVLSLKFDLDRLKVSDPFQAREVVSSQPDVLSAVLNDDSEPPLGNFSLRPAQLASSQQLISQQFESVDDIKSAGEFSFGFGGFVDKGISLDDLNNGEGVARGEIKVTDLAGNSSLIDLSLARSVDDVIDAINNDTTVNVTASTDGDSFTLVDNVGGTGTLSVQDVKGGSTAADLGLTIITTSTVSDEVSGADVYGLHADTKLSDLNDGNGVRLTGEGINDLKINLSGELEPIEVDLSGSTTLGDVLDKINTASTDGDEENPQNRLNARISDDGNRITIEDARDPAGTITVSSDIGSAAADLGIEAETGVAQVDGERLVSGLRDTLLSSLKGGVGLDRGVLAISDRDGGQALVSLTDAETLSDVLDAINASGLDVVASLNDTRNGIVVNDTSGGTADFAIADASGSSAADLGIVVLGAVSSIDGGSLDRQTLSEATLLSSLNGGEGISANDIRIFDSIGSGNSSSGVAIDLNSSGSEAKTIGDVIDAINNSSASVTASINDKGDGILITDTGGGDESLRIEDVNGSLAEVLNLTGTSQTVDNQQVIDGTTSYTIDLSEIDTADSSISLDSLNDGSGINRGDIRITDSRGEITSIDLNGGDSDITTVQQLIDAINERDADVTASINSAGTGIQLTDNANGDGTLVVEDISGTSAADLNILSTDSTTTSINGFGVFSSQSASQGALNNVATEINNLEAGVTASVLNDGQGFRLQLIVDKTGSANTILFDSGDSGFDFTETSSAQDGLLIVGGGSLPGSGVLVSSSSNDFSQVIDGVDISAQATSDTAIDVTVSESDQEIVDLVQSFIDSYNTLRDDLSELTAFDEESLSTGLLFGTTEALRVDTSLSRLVTDRYSGLGEFSSLQEIGISVDENGKLSLDQSTLKDAYAEDSQSLQRLFTAEDDGIVDRFSTVIDRLTNSDNGLLTNRDNSLQATIDVNESRIERFNESLERQRERLELEFYNLELLISNLQSSQNAVNAIQAIPALGSS